MDTKSPHKSKAQLSAKYKPLWKCSKRFIPPQTDGMIRFHSNICSLFRIESNFQVTKKQQQKQKKALQSVSQNSHRSTQTNAGDKGCAEACAERFSALKTNNDVT